jgi:hypothetical protein
MPNVATILSNVGAILFLREESLFLNEQNNLALKDYPKEEILGCRHLFQ